METLLIFAGIPVGVALVVTGLVYAGGGRRSKRYRPGRPFDFQPVWFLSAPERTGPEPARSDRHAVAAGNPGHALPAGAPSAPSASDTVAPQTTEAPGSTGGASDRW
jgi:hypothetical protein